MAEEDFAGAFVVNGWHNGCTDLKQILQGLKMKNDASIMERRFDF